MHEQSARVADLAAMVLLKRRIDSISRQMTQALLKSGRSGVLNTGMDFSTAVCDANFNSVGIEIGLPIHNASIELIPKSVVRVFGDDIKAGDCFATTSVFHGNTHCGDFTLCAPVFIDGRLVFYTVARAHFADMGFPIPSTYAPLARDLYEEGLQLPCVRIQRDHRDIGDVIRICMANIRVPDQFYGDYLSTLSAVRTGERALISLCKDIGLPAVNKFLIEWQDYARRIAGEAISKLPAGTIRGTAVYDSEDERYPDGIPVQAELTVFPEQRRIVVDLTKNIDNVPLGINLSESTTRAASLTGVFNVLNAIDPLVPRCSGSFSCVEIIMREGSAVGIPRFPAATSLATSNLCHVLGSLIQGMFGALDRTLGIASASIGQPPSLGVISGNDSRFEGQPYVNQLIIAYFGGPALNGYDGWLTFGGSAGSGALRQASVEIVEYQHPIIVEKVAIGIDSGGSGKYDGAPGGDFVARARNDSVRWTGATAAKRFPPWGLNGGSPGRATRAWKVDTKGERVLLPQTFNCLLEPGDRIVAEACGGGGFGNPMERDPERVRRRTREGWISVEKARHVYGVGLDTTVEEYAVQSAETKKLRSGSTKPALTQSGVHGHFELIPIR